MFSFYFMGKFLGQNQYSLHLDIIFNKYNVLFLFYG